MENSKDSKHCAMLSPMEKSIRRLAGAFILISVVLGYFVSPYWFLLTTFVGLNLFQSSFTNFCPAENIFSKLGVKRN